MKKYIILIMVLWAVPLFGADYTNLPMFTVDTLEIRTSAGVTIDSCNITELIESMGFLLRYNGMYPGDGVGFTPSVYYPPSAMADELRQEAKNNIEFADKLDKAKRVYEECKEVASP